MVMFGIKGDHCLGETAQLVWSDSISNRSELKSICDCDSGSNTKNLRVVGWFQVDLNPIQRVFNPNRICIHVYFSLHLWLNNVK